ncbi:DMT family transporter [Solimonas marina]|nr:DMT family transporter [Solimonas marina]
MTHPRAGIGGLAFVVLWSTGYIAAAAALHGSGPYTLAVVRFAGSAALIGLWLLVQRAAPASRRALLHAAVAGVLLQAGFFGFTYAGLRTGVSPAVAGLITGLMPLTTAAGAALLLGERLKRGAALGLVLGLAGVLFVIVPDLRIAGSVLGYVFMLCALLALSAGTLYQKRHATTLDPRLALVVQLLASLVVLLPFAWHLERLQMHAQPWAIAGIVWIILCNSCAGLLLYLWLLRHGGAGRVSGLFYLVPPVTAVLAALLLGARFGWHDAVGFGLAAAGVWLGQRG